MKKILAVLMALCLWSAGSLAAEEKAARPAPDQLKKILEDFDRYTARAAADWKIPGLAVGIVRDGALIFAKGYGVKELGGKDPVTENTIFQIGSTSKAFTAALAAMLVDEGKFKWEDRVVNHVPDFRMYDPWVTREFRIGDLLSQKSGMPAYAGDFLFFLGYDRSYIQKTVRHIKPVASFRAQYAYQNNLWLVAGEILEKYGGRKWEQLLQERIFDPLGMAHSSADAASYLKARDAASLHAAHEDGVIVVPKSWPFLDWSYVAGPAGAINSNVKDMAKWLAFQMNKGRAGDRQLVSEKNLQVVHSPKTITAPGYEAHKNIFYCLGWIYQEYSPYPVVWHNGGTLMKTMVGFVPEQKIGIVVLSNYLTGLPELLAFRFFDLYAGKEVKDTGAEALEKFKKAQAEEKAQKPVPPVHPRAALPLEKYAGAYENEVYGPIQISIVDGKLNLVMGPKKVRATLRHWDQDLFQVRWTLYGPEQEAGFAGFQVDARGKVSGVVLDYLDQDDDLGSFKRQQEPEGQK